MYLNSNFTFAFSEFRPPSITEMSPFFFLRMFANMSPLNPAQYFKKDYSKVQHLHLFRRIVYKVRCVKNK